MPANKSVERNMKLTEKEGNELLDVTVGGKPITPGLFIPKADAQKAPELSFPGATAGKKYLAVCIDPDAPFASFSVLGPILHWIQSGFQVEASATKLTSVDPVISSYIAPAPPPPSGPHRYVVFLYEEPATFDVKKFAPADGKPMSTMSRMRYDLDAFEKEAGLSPAIAANFFTSN